MSFRIAVGFQHIVFKNKAQKNNFYIKAHMPPHLFKSLTSFASWYSKEKSRQVVKLKLAAMSERPNVRNRFVSLVWAENVASAYNLRDVYVDESRENFCAPTNDHPSGHTGLTSYEIDPEVRDIMLQIAERIDQPWGPVRLAAMLGHTMGAALFNPTVLTASFDAVRKERVFERPLVVRESKVSEHRADLKLQKSNALSALASSMADNLVLPHNPHADDLQEEIRDAIIPDPKWDMFRQQILRSDGEHEELRRACAIYFSFSSMYDESQKSADKIAAFWSILTRADNAREHQAVAEAEAAGAQLRVAEAFTAWMEARVDSLTGIVSKVHDARAVHLVNYSALLTAGLQAIPADDAARKFITSFIPQLNRITKTGEKVSQELQLRTIAIQNLKQKVLNQKAAKFPHASCPPSLDATRAFDEASRQWLEEVAALKGTLEQEVAKEAGFDAVRQRAAAPPAPDRGVSGVRA
jgi:hypothetical protein